MDVRDKLNQNRTLGSVIAAVLLVACVGVFLYRSGAESQSGNAPSAFFTVDDGKTWFADDSTKLAPFMKDGKPAYRVFVWTCDKGKTKFVSHLERYTDEAKSRIEQSRTQSTTARRQLDPTALRVEMTSGVEVKRPNDATWIPSGTPESLKITTPHCPSGSSGTIEPVIPK